MKNLIYNTSKILAMGALGAGLLFTASCKKNFENINDDPNNPKDVPNSYYLAGAQRGIMDNTIDIWWGGQVGNQLAQYWSSNQYSAESRYQFRTSITNSYWGFFYAGGLNDANVDVGGLYELKKIVDNCKAEPGPSSVSGDPENQIAVATILRVWLFQNMTDAWGDIPYSQALDPAIRTPKYDKQSDIYIGLLGEINDALGRINTGAGPEGDIIYGGDMVKWAKFGNAVKMRLAMRMADVNTATAQAAFTQAVTAGSFTSNSDNAILTYEGGSSGNPVYYNFAIDKRNDYAASQLFLDNTLAKFNDPRTTSFFAPATGNGSWTGEVYGLSEAHAAATPNSSVSQRSALVLSATLPGIYMDYAQVEFMMAEAAERGWGVADAQSHYNNGISASIEFWTALNGAPASQGDIDAYIAQDSVDYNITKAAGGWKVAIGRQKWIALFNQGIQGWSEWRRLDFGKLELPADPILDGTGIPNRMKYAVDEQTLNSANYNAAINDQGGVDIHATKLWWDIN